ncbi:isoprenylcysteine carboxylmethyltransferase family protein [Pseudomonadota bacterium]|nr:isoprenylcysteine carboxylmethyltransferase family protein [Pseudomonadota bacterium]
MLKLKIPPPVYMLFMAGMMWLLDRYLPINEFISKPWDRLGFGIILLAIVTDGLSLLHFFRVRTSINPLYPEKANSLVTTGLYQWTRNPMYLGLLLVLLGWAIVLGSASPFIVLPIFTVVLTIQQIIPEEIVLEHKFGKSYRDYKQTVRRWF